MCAVNHARKHADNVFISSSIFTVSKIVWECVQFTCIVAAFKKRWLQYQISTCFGMSDERNLLLAQFKRGVQYVSSNQRMEQNGKLYALYGIWFLQIVIANAQRFCSFNPFIHRLNSISISMYWSEFVPFKMLNCKLHWLWHFTNVWKCFYLKKVFKKRHKGYH